MTIERTDEPGNPQADAAPAPVEPPPKSRVRGCLFEVVADLIAIASSGMQRD